MGAISATCTCFGKVAKSIILLKLKYVAIFGKWLPMGHDAYSLVETINNLCAMSLCVLVCLPPARNLFNHLKIDDWTLLNN